MSIASFTIMHNGTSQPLSLIAQLSFPELSQSIIEGVRRGLRLISFFGRNQSIPDGVEIIAVLADDLKNQLFVARAILSEDYSSITPECPQAHLFEREIYEQFGFEPLGHPWLKPLRFSKPMKGDRKAPTIGEVDFYKVIGDQVHEVAVGPVHAGVIEPGHFRFQCHGEEVFHLEISLGYQYRGVEEALIGGPHKTTLRQIEAVAGDTSIGHAWAYCMANEALSSVQLSAREDMIRGIAAELERLANHTGDLGALAGDVGYLPTMSFCGRLRGDFLNMSALLCGNRFGRSLLRPGGCRFDITEELQKEISGKLESAWKDARQAVELLWNSSSVMTRFEGTGTLTKESVLDLGIVGLAARAAGIERDVRCDHSYGPYRFFSIPVAGLQLGDVAARAFVRWLEIARSVRFVREGLASLPPVRAAKKVTSLAAQSLAVSLVEGWRGEICHVAITDSQGKFARYKITDPSFHNWTGLALSLRGQQISDFPLCNKSFNLSYCGFDL